MSRRRRTEHKFSEVPRASIPRSQFNRSHTHKSTFDAGYLIPIYVDEVLPGDTFNLNMIAFARLATPIYPLMDNMSLDFFFFFIPYRLVWENWQKFCGEQDNPGDSTDFTIPQSTNAATSCVPMTNLDYMGIPPGTAGPAGARTNATFSALPLRSLHLVWNEWFRDQNLQDAITVDKDDGPDASSTYWNLLRRGKRHDYFTSCLPWPQKGPGVELPVGGTADVVRETSSSQIGVQYDVSSVAAQGVVGNTSIGSFDVEGVGTVDVDTMQWGESTGLMADLTTAEAVTINSLREAFQLQKLFERDARGGTRYTELVKSHFGVTSPDARLQRSELLSTGSCPIIINAVPQSTQATTATNWDTDQKGSLAAYGTSAGRCGFTKSFVEHGTIIGLVSARADLTYQQGLHRMWSRSTRNDFYWPALANLGEQAVLNKEIYFQGPDVLDGSDIVDDQVFGYQERWAEYRYAPSRISGLFRSEGATPLDAWHLAQQFATLPLLDDTFIQDTPPVDRVISVPSEPHFLFDSFFSIKCARPMPLYSVPGLIDHF